MGDTETSASHELSCHSCHAPFDALQATWCSCIVAERTLVCPSCLTCFCKAPPAYKRGAWSGAPRALWDRKLQEHHRDKAPPPNPAPGEARRPLVLVLDDEPEILRVAGSVIQSLGYGFIWGRDGAAGMELATRYGPDLLLTDALMPKIDGRELGLRLKQGVRTRAIKVVVMTSLYKSVRYENEAVMTFKVDDYLRKPLDISELREVLEKHLD